MSGECRFRVKKDKLIAEFFVSEFDDEAIEALVEELKRNYYLMRKLVRAKKKDHIR